MLMLQLTQKIQRYTEINLLFLVLLQEPLVKQTPSKNLTDNSSFIYLHRQTWPITEATFVFCGLKSGFELHGRH